MSQSKTCAFQTCEEIPPIFNLLRIWRRRDASQPGPLEVPKQRPRIANGIINQFGAFGDGIATTPRSCRQFVEQRLCLFQIECVEAFGEPAVDRSQ